MLQKPLNKSTQAITGMYQSISISLLISESGLIPGRIMLDYHQQKYALQLLILPNRYLAKNILPIILKIGNKNAQPADR